MPHNCVLSSIKMNSVEEKSHNLDPGPDSKVVLPLSKFGSVLKEIVKIYAGAESYLLSLAQYDMRAPKDTPEKEIKYWRRKTRMLRLRSGLLLTIGIYISLSICTPGYSFSFELAEILKSDQYMSQHAYSVVGTVWSSVEYSGLASHALVIKFSIIFLVFLIAWGFFRSADPMSDKKLLQNCFENKSAFTKSVQHIPFPEVFTYAQAAPSSYLRRVCRGCEHSGVCSNNLDVSGGVTYKKWKTIYENLDPKTINGLMQKIFRARKSLFWNMILKIIFSFSFVLYLTVRSYEYYSVIHEPVLSFSHLLFMLAVLFLILLHKTVHSSKRESNSGNWSNIADDIKTALSTEKFKDIFISTVCDKNGNPFRCTTFTYNTYRGKPIVQTLLALLSSMQLMQKERTNLKLNIYGVADKSSQRIRYIKYVLDSLVNGIRNFYNLTPNVPIDAFLIGVDFDSERVLIGRDKNFTKDNLDDCYQLMRESNGQRAQTNSVLKRNGVEQTTLLIYIPVVVLADIKARYLEWRAGNLGSSKTTLYAEGGICIALQLSEPLTMDSYFNEIFTEPFVNILECELSNQYISYMADTDRNEKSGL